MENTLREVKCLKCAYTWVTRSNELRICCPKCHRKTKAIEPVYKLRITNTLIYRKLLEMQKENEDEHTRIRNLFTTKRT